METELIARAECLHAPAENRFHLVQNIASAALRDTLFAQGIHLRGSRVQFLPKPHRRRPRSH
jgi:hypothetical protein